ncbi:MAG: xylose isomerase [Saprospiraceae bacterium]|nr:xylose isomerase [Saprospiraceae bacterium]MDW8485265.1 xylose isomerase [Saprospiraceae bacterium]
MSVLLGEREFFPGIGPIRYEGPETDNPLAFRYYDADRVVMGKTMREHFRFSMAYWHTMCGTGMDPFGAPTKALPWLSATDPLQQARDKMDAAFEFATKLGLPFFCFHDFDLVAEAHTLAESERRLLAIAEYAKAKIAASGVRVLWGTANLFSHPRYMNGAATNPDFAVVAHAAAQVKIALDLTIALGGQGYVFWGGREGYLSLLNTDMKREREHLARFLSAARDYARKQGFQGTLLVEPKPMEPSKHQYDFDAATTLNFLREFGLERDFKLNIEVNHATLALHTFAHELQVAADAGALGSIDANRGDYQNGWDTDQFPMHVPELTEAMLVLLEAGGLEGGGINFDAKTRRNSTDLADLFYAHIGGMDAFARALLAAAAVLEKTPYRKARCERYASFDSGDGQRFERGELGLEELYQIARQRGEPSLHSGRQELFENWVYRFC